MKSPLSIVKEKYGDKEKLVAAIEKLAKDDLWLDRGTGKGLAHVANAKLLHLMDTFSAVHEKFGTRAKLVTAILEIEKRTKDDGYKSRLDKFPVPRLWDMYRSLSKRHAPKKAVAKKAASAASATGAASAKAKKPVAKKA